SLIRLIIGIPGAIVVTIGLFLLMNSLISKQQDLAEQKELVKIDINAKVQEVDQIESLSDLQRPELDTPPPPPPATVDPTNRPSIDGVRAEVPKVEVDLDIGTGFNPDRDAQPLVRIPPQYPERCQARAKSLEFVIVQFDVDTQGVPQNIQVVEASSSCFNRAAVRSVERWKYQPKIVDGNPEWRRGVVQRISFQLAD
ncbi:MAG: energy transducer TonB, partial [Pseudomonadota bacterium]